MSAPPILTPKLRIPTLPGAFVSRPRLITRLNRVLDYPLAVVSAPAGFGKSSLLAEWAARLPVPVAWLSLDGDDNRLPRFWRYFIHACRPFAPQFGEEALALLEGSHQPASEVLSATVVNALAQLSQPGVVVLDDYHLLVEPTLHQAVEFLITHLPPLLHLVIVTRSTPPLNLALWRGRGRLLELDAAHLRFTAVEAQQFLREVMHLELAPAEQTILEMHTEGWITGLQLAGLSLQAHPAPATFLASFAGTSRYIADYLFEEVLSRQPPAVQRFLLYTSLVEAICSELAETLLQEGDGQTRLEWLEDAGLFISPLDDRRRWYRYHHLFGDLLRHHLAHHAPAAVPILHRRAGRWYEEQGRLDEAIRHALLGQDYLYAADLLEKTFTQPDWVHHGMARLVGWFESIPPDVVEVRPRLMLGQCWLLLEIYADRWHEIEAKLRLVEQAVAQGRALPAEAPLILAQVNLLHANRARHQGDFAQVIGQCQGALARLPTDEGYIRGGVLAHMGTAYERLDDLPQARHYFSEGMRVCRAAGNTDGYLFAAVGLITLFHQMGQLSAALAAFQEVEVVAARRTGPDMGNLYMAIAAVYLARYELAEARHYFEQGLKLCRPFEAWRGALLAGVIGLARTLAAQGQSDDARRLLLAEGRAFHGQQRTVLAAMQARLLLGEGPPPPVLNFLALKETNPLPAHDSASVFVELTYGRLLLARAASPARGDPLKEAGRLLQILFRVAEKAGRQADMIEILMLQALHAAALGETDSALRLLEKAVAKAAPEGFVELFAAEGVALFRLLTALRTRPVASTISPDFLQSLRAAFSPQVRQQAAALPAAHRLTAAEATTLRLLASARSIEEIAAELTVAISTVRTYTKRIYAKLGVHSRAEAVFRAQELDLL